MVKVHTEFTSDPSKVERDLQRINERYAVLQDKMRQTSDTSKKGSDSTVVALGKVAAGVGVVTKAYDLFTEAIQYNTQAQRDAAEATKASESGFRQLQQLADVNKPGDFARLKGEAQQFFAAGGGANQDEAARTLFSLISAGAGDERNRALFANLSSSGLVEDVGQTAASSRALQSALGKQETGSFEDIVSKALAASAGSPSTADQILAGASRAGGAARAIGLSDEELLTATAVAANITGSAEQAGTQVRSLAQSASTIPGLEGKNLQGIVADIQGRNLARGDLKKLLGTDEALAGFDALSGNSAAFGSLLGDVNAAAGNQLAARKSALADTDPALAAARQSRIEANQRQISEEGLGIYTNAADAVRDSIMRRQLREGASGFNQFFTDKQIWLERYLGDDEGFVDRYLNSADQGTQQRIQSLNLQGSESGARDRNAKLIEETNRIMAEQNQLLKQRNPAQPSAAEN